MHSCASPVRCLLCSSARCGALVGAVLWLTLWSDNAPAQTVRTKDEAARVVSIEKLSVKDGGTVSGEVRNASSHLLRDVDILVRSTWLWDDEFHPGTHDPSAADVYRLPQDVPPNGTVAFIFSPSPALPKASGGRFVTSVYVAGYSEVIPQK